MARTVIVTIVQGRVPIACGWTPNLSEADDETRIFGTAECDPVNVSGCGFREHFRTPGLAIRLPGRGSDKHVEGKQCWKKAAGHILVED